MSNLAILADSKTQNASLFSVHAMFLHDCPLRVKLASTQWNLVNKKKTWRDSAPIDMILSAVSVLVVVQLSSEVPEGLMNNPVHKRNNTKKHSTNNTKQSKYKYTFYQNTHNQAPKHKNLVAMATCLRPPPALPNL
jgi:hypothetical protein